MVKVSTLFHRVDGFIESDDSSDLPALLDQDKEDNFLQTLLEPLIFDPGDKLVPTLTTSTCWQQNLRKPELMRLN